MIGSQFDSFIHEIQLLMNDAKSVGEEYVEIYSGTLQKILGLNNRAQNCCRAMYQVKSIKDEIIDWPIAKDGSHAEFGNRLCIRYYV